MKLNHLIKGALAAIVMGSFAQTASAVVDYTTGDMILGFQKAGSDTIMFNIGKFTNYRDASSGSSFTLSLSGLSGSTGLLTTTYGANWATSGTVRWGIAEATRNKPLTGPPGTFDASIVDGDNSGTFYATKAEVPVGTLASPWGLANNTNHLQVAGSIKGLESTFAAQDATAGTNNKGVVLPVSTTNSWEDFNSGSISFQQLGGGVEGTLGDGTNFGPGSVLDLSRTANVASGPTTGTYLGKFAINQNGDVSFTAVPEPSTYAFLGLGALGLVTVFIRRKKEVKA